MKQYLDLSKKILTEGEYEWSQRTQTGTLSLFGEKTTYDLQEGFPLVSTKKVGWRLPLQEMLFFLQGENDLKAFNDKNMHIWDGNGFDFYLRRHDLNDKFPKHTPEWQEKFEWYMDHVKNDELFEEERTLGRVYGVQWRDWKVIENKKISSHDQIQSFLNKLSKNPSARSNLVTAFNPGEMPQMALPPCHMFFQSRVVEDDNRLDLLMYQRSCDTLLGVPFNTAQYAFLTKLIAREKDLKPGKFEHMYGNVHFYVGPKPRSEFLRNNENLKEFQGKVKEAQTPKDYQEIQNWYLENAPAEPKGTEGTDHIPFILTQLGRNPKPKPTLDFKIEKNIGFWDAINMDVRDVVKLSGYDPHPALVYNLNKKTIKPKMAV